MLNTRTETAEEKKERVFNHYKSRLKNAAVNVNGNESIRFNVIEYLCRFPGINPFVMAVSLIKEGITILYNDSAISKEENRAKEREVKKLLV